MRRLVGVPGLLLILNFLMTLIVVYDGLVANIVADAECDGSITPAWGLGWPGSDTTLQSASIR